MLTRSQADQHVQKLRKLVAHVNADDSYLRHFTYVAIFGSYVNSYKQDLGDLDLVFADDVRSIYSPGGSARARMDYLLRDSTVKEFMDASSAHETPIKLPGVHLHSWSKDGLLSVGTPTLVLFGTQPDVTPEELDEWWDGYEGAELGKR